MTKYGRLIFLSLFINCSLACAAVRDPCKCGAIPNDNNDDTLSFVTATSQMQSGDEFHIPAGTYNLDSNPCPMHFRIDNIVVRGDGQGRTILKYTSQSRPSNEQYDVGSLIFIGHISGGEIHDNVTVRDLTIQDLSPSPEVYGSSAIWTMYTSQVTIRDVEFIDCKGSSMYLVGLGPNNEMAKSLRVEDCYVHTSATGFSNAAGMTFGGWDGIWIRNNRFIGKLSRGGVEGGQGHNAFITNNVIHIERRPGDEGGHGLGNMALRNFVISGNTIFIPEGFAAIAFNSDAVNIPAGSTGIVSDNILSSFECVRIQTSNGGVQRNIQIRGNTLIGLYGVAVYWQIPKGVTEIADNVFDCTGAQNMIGELVSFSINGPPGVPFTDPSSHIRIHGNTITNGLNPNVWNPMGRIFNLNGWAYAADRKVHIFGNKIGTDILSSLTRSIDGHSIDPDPALVYDPTGKFYPQLDLPVIPANSCSQVRYVPMKGLLITDHVTCTSDQQLPDGVSVLCRVVLNSGKNEIAWQLVNHNASVIDPSRNVFRFWVDRK